MAIGPPVDDDAPLDWSMGTAPPLKPLAARRGGQGGPGAGSALTGGALIVLATFLPWLTATDGETVSGANTPDGPIMILLGVLLAGAGIGRMVHRQPAWQQIAPVLIAAFVGWAAYIDYGIIQARAASFSTAYVTASVGPGLHLVILGAVIAGGGCLSVTWEPDPREQRRR
jgi:hypothetical protein